MKSWTTQRLQAAERRERCLRIYVRNCLKGAGCAGADYHSVLAFA